MKIPELREKINSLASQSSHLEPEPDQRKEWFQQVGDYAEHFLKGLNERPVFSTTSGDPTQWSSDFLPDHPAPLPQLLAFVTSEIDAHGLDPASEGHLGYIPGGGLYPAALGDFVAAVSNRYAGVFFASPGAVRLENHLVSWMADIVGYPSSSAGHLASGGSIATLAAVVTARDAKEIKARQIPDTVVYCTNQVHHAVNKALRIAGLGEAIVRFVPTDKRFRMDVQALEVLLKEDRKKGLHPFLLVASAGTTDTGAVDPLAELAPIAKANNLWFHVDGAYGGFFVMSDLVKHLLQGIDQSDSLVIDPHKGLFLPYGTGTVLVRDGAALQNAHSYLANYMQDTLRATDERSPADLSPELSKHFRGMRMWLPLRLFGVAAFRAALDEKILLARYFHQSLAEREGFEVGPEPDLSVVLFRYCPKQGDADEFNRALVQAVQEDGRVFLSSTTVNQQVYLRLAVLSFRTHLSTIDRCLQVLEETVAQLLK